MDAKALQDGMHDAEREALQVAFYAGATSLLFGLRHGLDTEDLRGTVPMQRLKRALDAVQLEIQDFIRTHFLT
jgi:hypothetical protein